MKHPYRNTNIVLFILFAVIIWFRKADGSGRAQTTSLRWAALASFFAFVLIIERIIFAIARKSRK
ncbi:DUF3923 family protein [Lactobacillus apis]|uniref:DUF3923 family protein n=1 Tax=Lactobacillus apis TaxID=303541 RepID=UPI00061B3A62|nr:DUF3923 family protein [Lactobacillus apis]